MTFNFFAGCAEMKHRRKNVFFVSTLETPQFTIHRQRNAWKIRSMSSILKQSDLLLFVSHERGFCSLNSTLQWFSYCQEIKSRSQLRWWPVHLSCVPLNLSRLSPFEVFMHRSHETKTFLSRSDPPLLPPHPKDPSNYSMRLNASQASFAFPRPSTIPSLPPVSVWHTQPCHRLRSQLI